MDEHLDNLVDTLLREEIGGEAAPDLAPAILARADRVRLRWTRVLITAAAAAIVVAVAIWQFAPGLRPGSKPTERGVTPQAVQPAPVVPEGGHEVWQRGSVVVAQGAPVSLQLGGYCSLELAANSQLRIEGEDRAEAIFLEQGEVRCRVERSVGTFQVRTEVGTVNVTGTEFVVAVLGKETDMLGKRLFVKVLTGAVLVSGLWGNVHLAAGQQATLPEGGKIAGILTGKAETWIAVKADGATEARRFTPMWKDGGLDKEMLATFKTLRVQNRVELEWKMIERPRVLWVRMIVPEQENGVVVGVVTAKEANWIEVKPDGGVPERYVPRWIRNPSGEGGSMDQDMLRKFAELKIGDTVRIEWNYLERKRAISLEKIAAVQ